MKDAIGPEEMTAGGDWGLSGGTEIPLIDPVSMGQVDYVKGKIDEIHFFKGLSELREDMLEGMREWLQEILDNWPNGPEEESAKPYQGETSTEGEKAPEEE